MNLELNNHQLTIAVILIHIVVTLCVISIMFILNELRKLRR